MPYPPLELTHELRLRRWARLNHVPEEERDTLWHPVILDEMRQRDREAGLAAGEQTEGRVHRGHELRAAHFLRREVRGRRSSRVEFAKSLSR